MNTTAQKFGARKISKSIFCLQMLHLFDQNYSKHCKNKNNNK